MKNHIRNVFYLIAMIFTIAFINSCQEAELNFETTGTNEFSKQELIEIYTTYSDEKIGALDIDIDQLIESDFTLLEREDLLVQRIENFQSASFAEKINEMLSAYRKEYNESYLDGTLEYKEAFASKYAEKLRPANRGNSTCTYDLYDCSSNTGCANQSTIVFYRKSKCWIDKPIVGFDCKSKPSTNICFNSYYWESTAYQYAYPKRHAFTWYTNNVVYRSLMPLTISGFRDGTAPRYGTFLYHIVHKNAVMAAWPTADCPEDEWAAVTKFGVGPRGTLCNEPPEN